MREFPFGEDLEGKMTITVKDRDSDTFIEKHIEEIYWPDILKEFVYMLNGCGYIIDPVKAAEYIDKLSEDNGVI